jgi:hypothetical protein
MSARQAFTAVRVIQLHIEAPLQPAVGEPCNGCGVCCAAEPCPLGMLVSFKRQGRCELLQWQAEEQRYRCGALSGPPLVRAAAARWISAGSGCDSDLRRDPPADQPPLHGG